VIRAVYAIRHQFAGVITHPLYTQPPTDEQLAAARAAHGAAGWARPVPLALEIPDGAHQLADYLDEFPEPEPAPVATQGFPGVRFRATGVITPPSG
jgi:hypothetical protein